MIATVGGMNGGMAEKTSKSSVGKATLVNNDVGSKRSWFHWKRWRGKTLASEITTGLAPVDLPIPPRKKATKTVLSVRWKANLHSPGQWHEVNPTGRRRKEVKNGHAKSEIQTVMMSFGSGFVAGDEVMSFTERSFTGLYISLISGH
jgi:hypothetical protein